MRKLVLLLCVVLILLLPMAALATGEDPAPGVVGPDLGIEMSLMIVAMLIVLDTVLGVLKGIMLKDFHWSLLPQFLATGVVPFLGGLIVLAVMAHFIPEPFAPMFYVSAAAASAKYVSDIWDKLRFVYGENPKV